MALGDFCPYFYYFTNAGTQWVSQTLTSISNPRTPWNRCFSGPQRLTASCGFCLMGSPWWLHPTSPLLVSTEKPSSQIPWRHQKKGVWDRQEKEKLWAMKCEELPCPSEGLPSFEVGFEDLASFTAQTLENTQYVHLGKPPAPGPGLRLFRHSIPSITKHCSPCIRC